MANPNVRLLEWGTRPEYASTTTASVVAARAEHSRLRVTSCERSTLSLTVGHESAVISSRSCRSPKRYPHVAGVSSGPVQSIKERTLDAQQSDG